MLHIVYNICTLCYNMYTWEAANDDEITIISYDDKECAATARRTYYNSRPQSMYYYIPV